MGPPSLADDRGLLFSGQAPDTPTHRVLPTTLKMGVALFCLLGGEQPEA